MHERLSIHAVCFPELSLPQFVEQCRVLGAQRLDLTGQGLLAPGGLDAARAALRDGGIAVQSIAHVLHAGPLSTAPADRQAARDRLHHVIDAGLELGAHSVYMLTGGHGALGWNDAADCFCETLAPCLEHARTGGIVLAIENASALYADLHIAHSLADTLKLVELADLGICVELFHCWAEAELDGLLARALPRCCLVQLSDYVYGDRSLPARAVPGDGAIPIATIVDTLIGSGYRGVFDLELLGPRIDAEGHAAAVTRAAGFVGRLLDRHQRTSS